MAASEVVLGITYCRQLLTRIGLISPTQFSKNRFVYFVQRRRFQIIVLPLLLNYLSTTLYFLIHLSNLSEGIRNGLFVGGGVAPLAIYIAWRKQSEQIIQVFDSVEKFIATKRLHISPDYLNHFDATLVAIAKYLLSRILLGYLLLDNLPFGFVLFTCCRGIYTESDWIFYYKIAVPFQVDTGVKLFFYELFLTCSLFVSTILFFYIAFTYGSIVIYVLKLLDDFKISLKTVGQNAKEPWKLEIAFRQMIRYHVKLISISEQLAGIMSFPILISCIACTASICMAMVICQSTPHFAEGFFFAVVVLSFLFQLFLVCFTGDMLTGKLEDIAFAAYEMPWPEMPLKQQIYMMVIMMRAQKTYYMTGEELVVCSLNNFGAILKFTTSVYVLLNAER